MSTEQEAFLKARTTERLGNVESGVFPIAQQRERGLWSFLTWSFFLSQIVAGQAFLGSAANAAQGTDLNLGEAADDGQSRIANTLAELEHDRSAIEDGSLSGETAPVMIQNRPQVDDPQLNATGLNAIDDASATSMSFAQGGSGTASVVGGQEIVGDGSGGAGDIPAPIQFDGGGILPGVLDIAVDGTLVPVLGVVDDLVGALNPLLAQTLSPVVGVVDDLLAAVNPVVDQALTPVFATTETALGVVFGLLGAEPSGNSQFDIIASAGDIHFSANVASGSDDLFSNGRYTDYNIELHAGGSDDALPSVSGEFSADTSNLIADIAFDHFSSNGIPSALSGVGDDTAYRHIGDGLT